jgi:hypothetical protein
MTTTRQKTKDKLDSMVDKLKSIEITAIELGMLYQESDVILSGVMLVVSDLVIATIPLIEQANKEL